LSGFFSKDAVVYGALEHGHPWLYAVGVVTAGITAYYMFRLLFVTFFGTYRGAVDPSDLGIRHPELAGTPASSGHHPEEEEPHHHAPEWLMAVPVGILIVPTVAIGWLDFGPNAVWKAFWTGFFPHASGAAAAPALSETLSTLLILVVVALGIALAYLRYGAPAALRDAIAALRTETVRMPGVLVHAYYFDAAYEALLVRPAYALGAWFDRFVDPKVIDAGVREAAWTSQWLGHLFRSFQTGLVRAYALTLAFGVACIVAYYAFTFVGGGR
jgi:NADH:ubiquinone oxidoreductase subunit 5 (subunit L)/multisubunit Na+/H+ antiporter MnhA subunit